MPRPHHAGAGAAKCAALIERVLALESMANVRDLRDLLQVRG